MTFSNYTLFALTQHTWTSRKINCVISGYMKSVCGTRSRWQHTQDSGGCNSNVAPAQFISVIIFTYDYLTRGWLGSALCYANSNSNRGIKKRDKLRKESCFIEANGQNTYHEYDGLIHNNVYSINKLIIPFKFAIHIKITNNSILNQFAEETNAVYNAVTCL